MTDVSTDRPNTSLLIRGAIWIAIGALIAAALVCVVWVLIGDQDGLIGRAFLTILLLAGFAGIAIAEASLAPNRPDWLALASMISWIVALIVGAVKIWLPEDGYFGSGAERFFQLLLVVGILQLALLHARLYLKASQRHVTTFTKVITYTTFALMVGLVGMLVFYLTFPDLLEYTELYWRIVVALTILVAVGTTLIPLLNALFAPRKSPAALAAPAAQQQPMAWPTYADGRTPLPVMPDGSPDWNAYYTGYPTYPVQTGASQGFPALENQAQVAPVQAPSAPAADAPAAPPAPVADAPPAPPAPQAQPEQPAPPAPVNAEAPPAPSTPPAPPAPPTTQAPPAPPAPPVPPQAG